MEHQTFWKPEKKVKEKKPYNSLQSRGPKPKKEIPEWKKDILSSHQSKPSRADRAEFPTSVVSELITETENKCQCGCGRSATSTHHVMPRGRSGRGVKTNAMRLCDICHERIQTDETELQFWIGEWTKKHGNHFWFDEQDWDEFNRKQTAVKVAESEQKERMDQLEPIISLLSTAAGRKLKAKEIRLLDRMDQWEMSTFVQLMHDALASNAEPVKQHFGYGHFED